MSSLTKKLSTIIGQAFEKCGYDKKYGKVVFSNRPDLCQFQCNGAMAANKSTGKDSKEIAQEVVNVLKGEK